MQKIGILIPCYNVEKTIRGVLDSLTASVLEQIEQIVVIDNFSSDGTLRILNEIQRDNSEIRKRLVIIENQENYGLGGSQKIGYQYFLDEDFSHFMIIHGDGQGNCNEIARNFLDTLYKTPDLDIVMASRFIHGSDISGYNWMRKIGNIFFNILTYILTGHRMTDSGCGIILYRTNILKLFPVMELTNSSQFNPQLNILVYDEKKLQILEIPLKWEDSEAGSSLSALKYCLTLLNILFSVRINKTIFRKRGSQLFHMKSEKFTPKIKIFGAHHKPSVLLPSEKKVGWKA